MSGRVGVVNAGDPAGGVVAPGRPLGLRIGHVVGPTGGVKGLGEPRPSGLGQVFPLAGCVVCVGQAHARRVDHRAHAPIGVERRRRPSRRVVEQRARLALSYANVTRVPSG